jgi:hypothetical protein
VTAKKAVQHGAGYSWLIEGQAGCDSKWMWMAILRSGISNWSPSCCFPTNSPCHKSWRGRVLLYIHQSPLHASIKQH